MKKAFILLLTAIILLNIAIPALAEEEFQLRNGILFGDTLEEVKKKETLPIESSSEETNNVWFKGSIAGMDGGVRFDFDEETGKLIDMIYQFNSKSDRDSVDSEYSTLQKSLIRKYGNPLGNTGGNLHLITGPAIEEGATFIGLYKYLLDGDGDFRDYDEWIVKSNGYNVKIDLFCFYVRTKNYDYSFYNFLSYHYYTDDDYTNAIQEKMDENAAVDNDL